MKKIEIRKLGRKPFRVAIIMVAFSAGLKPFLLFTICYLLSPIPYPIFPALYAAVIESVKFDPATGDNVIKIYPETLPPGATAQTFTYRVWYSSGNHLSQNSWEALPETTQTTVRHYIGNRLGDFRYCAQHKFGDGPWVPSNVWDAPVAVSYYIHDVKRGSPTEQENEENQLGMGPSWFFKYQLQDDSYVTIRIFPASTTVTGYSLFGFPTSYSHAPIRTLIHEVPRSGEMVGSVWWNTDEWDCRDSTGNIVPNGIYWVSIDAYNNLWRTFDPSDKIRAGRRGNWFGSIPVDVLRIMKFYANPIVDFVGLKTFTYRLTGAANVKIRVYKDAPTFSVVVDSNPASPTYGEPIPSDPSKLVKTLNFYRPAGNWEEQWDGTDENGNFLPDGIYTYTISAINDYKRVATDMFGNDRPMFGNVTIMRKDPPSNAGGGTTGGSGNIIIGTYAPARGSVIKGGLSSVLVGVSASNLGITASNSYINIQKPSGAIINGSLIVTEKFVIAQFPPLTEEGVYVVDMKIADLKNRNWWVERYTFTIEKSAGSYSESVYAYPNPAKESVNIKFPGSSAKIRIYTITGDLLKEETKDGSPFIWNLSDVGSGLYFYAVEGDGYKVVKSLIVAK